MKSSRPDRPLRVMAQVNTSGETSKSGAEPGDDAVELCRYIDKVKRGTCTSRPGGLVHGRRQLIYFYDKGHI